MIGTILKIGLLSLLRERVALGLTFVLPVAFFSVFAATFSSMDADVYGSARTVVVVDPDSAFGTRLAERLAAEPGIEAEIVGPERREAALEQVRRGRAAVAVLLPPDLGARIGRAGDTGSAVELYADRSNPLATGVVQGRVQAAAAAATVETLAFDGVLRADGQAVPVRVVDALGRTGKRPSIAFFASGLGVLFLMFAVTGRSAILIEERESGVLSRMLAARVGMARLLVGRWLFLAVVGTVQVSVMFVWAALVFGLDLFHVRRLFAFLLVTVVTASAASAFGMVLSAASRTRARLNGIAAVVILSLSAIGGNMFPSFLMPEGLQAVGRLTFNAWALGAYQKVFWYERPVVDLLPELAALAAATAVFFGVAWSIASRWQRSGGLAS